MRARRKFSIPFVCFGLALSIAFFGAAPAWADNAPPVITAPATITAQEGVFFSVTITASAQDSTATVTLTGPGPFCGVSFSSFPGQGQTSGTLSGTPGFTCAGTYALTFTANDGVTSSSTTVSLLIQNTDRAPVVAAPGVASIGVGRPGSFTVSAFDPDGDAISSLTSTSSPATTGSTFTTNAANTSGTFSWTPGFTSHGTYVVTFTATNALTGTASTTVVACDCDRAPVVTAPTNKFVAENTLLTFTVSAADPDGQAITSFTASSNPPTPGSTFTTNASNASGTFTWTPSFTAAGSYAVTFTASNSLSGSAQTTIAVCNGCDRAPVVTAPAALSGAAGSLITFTVSAIDPDGDAIVAFTASGTAMSAGGTFTHDATFTSGTFSWTTGAAQAGTYSVTFFAANSLSGQAITQITVTGDHAPVVTAPPAILGVVNIQFAFNVTAADPDGDAITSFTAVSSPATTGSTFTVNATNTSGTFAWSPSFLQTGTYSVTFTASNSLSGQATTVITVCQCSRPPVVNAPMTVEDPDFTPISFIVSASDPDGDPITSLTASGSALSAGATFTLAPDNASGTVAWTPTPSQAGLYSAIFIATSGSPSLSGTATTDIHVGTGQAASARAFVTNSNKTIKLNTGKSQWCVRVEPLAGSFQISDIQLGSVVMRSVGTGSVAEIQATSGKTNAVGDLDHNGVDDGELCFAKGDLQLLFSNLTGRSTVNVTIAGNLVNGGSFSASLAVEVLPGGGGNQAASIAPNPLNPSGTLSFETNRSGVVRVRIFDGTGRLVRTVLDTPMPAGPHAVPLDARDTVGRPLASGVYFYRVEAPGDAMAGRFVVAK